LTPFIVAEGACALLLDALATDPGRQRSIQCAAVSKQLLQLSRSCGEAVEPKNRNKLFGFGRTVRREANALAAIVQHGANGHDIFGLDV
jgi:hypothetical protein